MQAIVISQQAEFDLSDACVWYEMHQEGLSKRFLKEFFRTINFIQQNPYLYQIRYKENYRAAKIHKFPFLVFFVVNETEILVNAVFHTSQDPTKYPE